MFSFFKSTSELEKLEKSYKKLLKEAYDLSTINRTKSDQKTFEAEQIAIKIQELKKQ
ncbi:MAG: Lacal_2735 family protein [Wenyingzhuangia sp.]|jgi:hypothetical protein|uniref:Lacal_2735 family protein n=1 Tax=Wenyingzhuangia sp. TaxID=1964193 RepID=UPI0032191EBC